MQKQMWNKIPCRRIRTAVSESRDLVDRTPEKSRFLPRTVTSVQFGSAPVDLMAASSILSIGTKGARKARGTLFFFNSATMLL